MRMQHCHVLAQIDVGHGNFTKASWRCHGGAGRSPPLELDKGAMARAPSNVGTASSAYSYAIALCMCKLSVSSSLCYDVVKLNESCQVG